MIVMQNKGFCLLIVRTSILGYKHLKQLHFDQNSNSEKITTVLKIIAVLSKL
jgi:hypothetical protein